MFEEHREEIDEVLDTHTPVLTEGKDLFIDNGGQMNFLIEGDNLASLKLLEKTHKGKIDLIYIDPPYNTGNKDFIYNDSYVDKEDSYRHSKWLSFMSRRLKIAKKLLSDRGVIFISIDDNEQAQLKLLCDEIFGADRFITNLIWQKKTGAADANGIAIITEYILVYCLDPQNAKNIFSYNKNAFDIKRYRYTDEFEKIRGPFYYDSLDRGSIQYSDGLNYGIEAPDGSMIFPNGRLSFVNDGWTWKWSKEKVEWGIKNKFIEIVPTNKKKNGWAVKYKIYLNVDNEGNAIEKSVPYKNLISGILNADAANDIKTIFNSKAFSYAKPIELIKLFINLIANKKGIILDFFAGSGTTLHATMQLNAEDGGHRQCILVTNNENNICEEVTYERNRRVIQGYTNAKGEEVAGLTKNNLRYYRTGFVGRNRSMQNMRKLVNLATDMLCIKEDLYTEQNTFGGQKTYKGIFRYFDDGKKQMLVIYREEAIDELVDIIYDMDIPQPIKVYVFSPSEDPWEGSFDDVSDKVELCALPQAIYNTYRRILPKKKDAIIAPEDDALATTQKDKDLFDGMLNFTDEEEA